MAYRYLNGGHLISHPLKVTMLLRQYTSVCNRKQPLTAFTQKPPTGRFFYGRIFIVFLVEDKPKSLHEDHC